VPDAEYVFPENTMAARLKLVSTGHGWGTLNTGNAAEFYDATHDLYVNGVKKYSQHNWVDCNPNPDGCQPQNGTWYHNRAGWCPGSIAQWFDFSLNEYVNLDEINLGYTFYEQYVDQCHPNHPDCVTGVTCTDCSDGFNPVLDVACNLVSYSESPFIIVSNKENLPVSTLLSVFPNPSTGRFVLTLNPGGLLKNAEIIVTDNLNRPVVNKTWNGETTSIDLSGQAPGLYFLRVITPTWSESRKLVLK